MALRGFAIGKSTLFPLQIQLQRDKEKWCPYGGITDQRFKASSEGSTALQAYINHIHHGVALGSGGGVAGGCRWGSPAAGWGSMLMGMERGVTPQAGFDGSWAKKFGGCLGCGSRIVLSWTQKSPGASHLPRRGTSCTWHGGGGGEASASECPWQVEPAINCVVRADRTHSERLLQTQRGRVAA